MVYFLEFFCLEIIFLAVQSTAKMHCALRQLVSADTHEILHNWGKAVFVCTKKHVHVDFKREWLRSEFVPTEQCLAVVKLPQIKPLSEPAFISNMFAYDALFLKYIR